jgi:hypothetical protein
VPSAIIDVSTDAEDAGGVAPVSITPGGGSVGAPLEEQPAAQAVTSNPTSLEHRPPIPLLHLADAS